MSARSMFSWAACGKLSTKAAAPTPSARSGASAMPSTSASDIRFSNLCEIHADRVKTLVPGRRWRPRRTRLRLPWRCSRACRWRELSSPETPRSASGRFARACATARGDYLFTVKANQPQLMADIALAFGDAFPPGADQGSGRAGPRDALWDGPPPDLEQACTVEKGHGRLETRRIATSREVVPDLDWPGVAQA